MTVTELFAELTRKGVQIAANGDELTVHAPKGVLTPPLRAALAEKKTEILTRLRQARDGDDARPQLVPAPQARHQPFPLTDIQQAYWIGRTAAIELGAVACQVYYEMEFAGLDVPRLNRAWQCLIDRHDMLRAIVRSDGQQQILAQVPAYQFEVLDLAGRESIVVTSELEQIREDMSHRVTAADQWPLFEIRATRLDGGRTRLRPAQLIIAIRVLASFCRNGFSSISIPPRLCGPCSCRFAIISQEIAAQVRRLPAGGEYWLRRVPFCRQRRT
jgi:epothilone synthetase B